MTRMPRGAVQLKWRRQRQQQARRWPTLNLVALMDVFTILVFFFLVHSGDGAPEGHNKLVNLPESVASLEPRDTPVVMITRENILLQGVQVARIDAAMQSDSGQIEALDAALQAQLATPDGPADMDRELTIMGDRSIPFELLNRVMLTCVRAGFGNISLSVLQRVPGAT